MGRSFFKIFLKEQKELVVFRKAAEVILKSHSRSMWTRWSPRRKERTFFFLIDPKLGVCVCMLSSVRLFQTLCSLVDQALSSMEFSRQENWCEMTFPTPISYICRVEEKFIHIFSCISFKMKKTVKVLCYTVWNSKVTLVNLACL